MTGTEPHDTDDSSFWDPILEGERDPVEILYVVDPSSDMTEDDLEEVLDGLGFDG